MTVRSTMIRVADLSWKEKPVYVNRNEENFESSFHAHDFIELAYISEGKGYHHIGNQVHAVSKGDVCILPEGMSHVFRPASAHRDQRLVVYNCIFTEGLLEHLTELVIMDLDLGALLKLEPDRSTDQVYWLRDRQLSFEPLFLALYEEYSTNRSGSSAVMYALLIQLLVALHRQIFQPAVHTFEPEDPLAEAIHYIHAHSNEEISIRIVADLCKLSERHFFRLFKQRTGQTFHSYVQHTRIRSACELLQCTTQKIGVISETVGYADSESFYRVFKRIVGTTPGLYRKQR